MTHILEFIHKDKVFTANEVIQEQVTNLMTRMYDVKMMIENPDEIEIIESWRNELVIVRNAIRALSE